MERTGLIPARFVTLVGHFVMLTMALNCRDANVKACLSYNYDKEDYDDKDKELLAGIFIAFAFLAIEMFGFIFGFSMFMPLVASVSVAGHVFACVSLSYWLVDSWDCAYFWWVFVFCSFMPGVMEIAVITNTLLVKRIAC